MLNNDKKKEKRREAKIIMMIMIMMEENSFWVLIIFQISPQPLIKVSKIFYWIQEIQRKNNKIQHSFFQA